MWEVCRPLTLILGLQCHSTYSVLGPSKMKQSTTAGSQAATIELVSRFLLQQILHDMLASHANLDNLLRYH